MTTIIRDICEGLSYIHNSPVLQQHGYLTSESCLVDERWQVKLNYYGLKKVKMCEARSFKCNLFLYLKLQHNKVSIPKTGCL